MYNNDIVDNGGASNEDLSDPDNETQSDNTLETNNDPFMDWLGDDKYGEILF